MRSVNKVILIGNLTRSPELKSTTGGQSIASFGMATNRQWTTSSGEKRNSAEFHEVVAWAKLAEICNDYLKKGMLVYIEGYLKTRSWDLEDGTRRFKTEVVASDMIILEKRGDGEYEEVSRHSADDTTPKETPATPAPAEESTTEETPAAEVTEPVAEVAPTEAPAATPEAPAEGETTTQPGTLSANIDDDNMF